MKNETKNFSALINNESFLRWLRGTSSADETTKWRKWHLESFYNQELTRKAKKIINMPFENPDVSAEDVKREIERFNKHFLRLVNDKGSE